MKKLFILLTVGLGIFEFSIAQTNEISKLDSILSQRYDEMITANSHLRYDSLAAKFKYELEQAILNSPDEKFDSLSTRIKVVESENRKLAIYSWDEGFGGSWHSMTVLVKFSTKNYKVNVVEIGGNEIETSAFTDAMIYEIHDLIIDDKIHFLTIGWGTHGSGHHHKIVQIFKIENGNFINCKNCFDFNDNLVIQAARIYEINVEYNSGKMEITHDEFIQNEGFYMETGNSITWKLIDGKFKKR